jgi:hypothetical protein
MKNSYNGIGMKVRILFEFAPQKQAQREGG